MRASLMRICSRNTATVAVRRISSVFFLSRGLMLSDPQPRVKAAANWASEITWSKDDERHPQPSRESQFPRPGTSTSCSPDFFKTRLSEHDNIKPINELSQTVEAQKSVDQHTGRLNFLTIRGTRFCMSPRECIMRERIRRHLARSQHFFRTM